MFLFPLIQNLDPQNLILEDLIVSFLLFKIRLTSVLDESTWILSKDNVGFFFITRK